MWKTTLSAEQSDNKPTGAHRLAKATRGNKCLAKDADFSLALIDARGQHCLQSAEGEINVNLNSLLLGESEGEEVEGDGGTEAVVGPEESSSLSADPECKRY